MTKFAFVFPGQGSQAIGMLDGFADNVAVQETVAQASEVLKQDIASLIAQGPKEVLDLTTNTQTLMLTAAVACYRAWIAAGGAAPTLVAGHSLGEYSALVAAGVLSFEEALSLVRFRAEAMQHAVPVGVGGMVVILGMADLDVIKVCSDAELAFPGQVVQAVNFNAPAQVVIAGHSQALEHACDLAKQAGAKRAMKLPVSAPFHSALMQPVCDSLAQYMLDLAFKTPQIGLINNVDVAIVNDPQGIKDALVRQAAKPVRWVETVQAMAAQGVTHVIECGPGKVLTGLNKRIAPALQGDAIVDQVSLQRVLALQA